FKKVESQYGRPGMEYPVQTLRVEYRSAWHRKAFAAFAVFFMPFAQGRLAWLKLFFKPETANALRQVSADFFISAGSSMTPLNLCLARECRAKSIVLMKPFWPFNYYRYDLALVPAHDRGPMPRETFRTLLVPSLSDDQRLEWAGRKFGMSLKAASRVRLAVFLGGPTHHYRMSVTAIEKVIQLIENASDVIGDYLVTTSRRTPEGISRFLKERFSDLRGCQELVIASEDARPEVVPGMMKLAEILVITEDSISMISEAVTSSKKVVVLGLDTENLPAKHRRFLQALREKSAIVMAGTEDLVSVIQKLEAAAQPALAREQDEALVKKLEAIL
ncbi:MAG: mitochondrial fission ELM1 family protein, partial [Candidatus Omnitrophica bacterium]|nr:mitochondrial fission ELM1 family protein [Candidatus Omnitrophota bacterium]